MSYTKDQIEAAINAAESVAHVTYADTHPVALTNGTLLALIAGAKGEPRDPVYIEELETAIEAAMSALRNATRN